MIFIFWMLSFKPTFSLSSFTFIKRLFSSSLLYATRVVSSAYLRLLIFLPAILIPACASSSPVFLMMYSGYKLNKQGDNIQPWHPSFPIWNQSVVPCPVLTVASWLRGQSDGLVFPSLSEFSTVYCDTHTHCLTCMLSRFNGVRLCNPMDCSPPCSSVHRILQARILEWVAIGFSRGNSDPGIKPVFPALKTDSSASKPPGKPYTYLMIQQFCSLVFLEEK